MIIIRRAALLCKNSGGMIIINRAALVCILAEEWLSFAELLWSVY